MRPEHCDNWGEEEVVGADSIVNFFGDCKECFLAGIFWRIRCQF